MKKKQKMNYIWRDRKRILGMPITFTRYYINEDRLFVETGFFTTQIEEVLLYRIRDMSVKIKLSQKLFGVGTITLVSSDKTMPVLELKNIKHPREIKETLHRCVEENKDKKRVRVGEIMDDHGVHQEGNEDEDLDNYGDKD